MAFEGIYLLVVCYVPTLYVWHPVLHKSHWCLQQSAQSLGKRQHGLAKIDMTLPETNISPENRPSQKESSIPTIHFQGQAASFREGTHQQSAIVCPANVICCKAKVFFYICREYAMYFLHIIFCCCQDFISVHIRCGLNLHNSLFTINF